MAAALRMFCGCKTLSHYFESLLFLLRLSCSTSSHHCFTDFLTHFMFLHWACFCSSALQISAADCSRKTQRNHSGPCLKFLFLCTNMQCAWWSFKKSRHAVSFLYIYARSFHLYPKKTHRTVFARSSSFTRYLKACVRLLPALHCTEGACRVVCSAWCRSKRRYKIVETHSSAGYQPPPKMSITSPSSRLLPVSNVPGMIRTWQKMTL